ncbi:MAG: cysteine desulfurase NifS [Candidatus Latescibacteria bacterium]|nr:cysteine desulfurase NifS [Candidatus Latescibacterota bacterium]
MKKIYLDHNATTPVDPRVLTAMHPYFSEVFGNPSSIHAFGREAKEALERARGRIAHLLRAGEREICFTGSGTEADNMAIKGVAHSYRNKGDHLITSQIEHHAVLASCAYLEKEGFRVTYLPVDGTGRVDPDDVRKAITDHTILITIMHANNEVGTIQAIPEIGRIAREHGVLFHTDAVQTAGKLPVDVDALNVDLLSLSGHKIYAPKGVGALYIRKGTKITPLIHGGHHEHGRRAGTENLASLVGFGKAAEIAGAERAEEYKRLTKLRDALHKKITDRIERVFLNGHPTQRIANTLNLSFAAVEGESIILSLDMEGIAVASGSACTSGSLESSHVLNAMGIIPELTQSSVRFSLGRTNTPEDMETLAEALPPIIERLRAMSPLT